MNKNVVVLSVGLVVLSAIVVTGVSLVIERDTHTEDLSSSTSNSHIQTFGPASTGKRDMSFEIGSGFDDAAESFHIQDDGKIIVSGRFTEYQGQPANRLIRLNPDGSRDTTFDVGERLNGNLDLIHFYEDGRVLLGGDFDEYQGQRVGGLIRLNSDWTRDATFDVREGFDGFVWSLAVQDDGKLIFGGWFREYQGQSAEGIIRLNPDGSRDASLDVGAGLANGVGIVRVQDDGKILVGGSFRSYQGQSVRGLMRLNSDGSRDTTFDTGDGINDAPSVIHVLDDGKILVGGRFTWYDELSANRIVRLNPDGTPDATFDFGSGFNDVVRTISIQDDGRMMVGGNFTEYQGEEAQYLVRLYRDGSRDRSFTSGFNNWNSVGSTIIQDDGKVLVGGWFTEYNGEPANNILRLDIE